MSQHVAGPRVLVFDSGVGGLSIAVSIDACLPDWELVYLADNAFFPYGEQPEDIVVQRCVGLIADVIAKYPVDMIVIGCNTASTVVLPALRQHFSCPVIGVVPAIKPAASLTRNRRIGLLATPATVRRPYLENLIDAFAGGCQVTRIGSSELVYLCENWMDTGRIETPVLARILAPLGEAEVDTVVLGCTHFPLIRSLLEPVLAPAVVWVDSGAAVARRIKQLWAQEVLRRGTASPSHPIPAAEECIPRLFFTGQEPAGVRPYLTLQGWLKPIIQSYVTVPQARIG